MRAGAAERRAVPDGPDGLLDVRAAAQLLNLPEKTVRLWARERRIPCVRFGTGRNCRVRFRRPALEQWIEKHAVPMRVVRRRSVAR